MVPHIGTPQAEKRGFLSFIWTVLTFRRNPFCRKSPPSTFADFLLYYPAAVHPKLIRKGRTMKISRRKPLTARAGLMGVGLDTYWEQFPGLLDELMKKMGITIDGGD